MLLRKTQLKFLRKMGLSILLCLSLVMATIALVRVSGFSIGGTSHTQVYDLTWQLLLAIHGRLRSLHHGFHGGISFTIYRQQLQSGRET